MLPARKELRCLAEARGDEISPEIHTAQHRLLLEAMPQMTWSSLPNGNHFFLNSRYYEFTGVDRSMTSRDGWFGLVHPDEAERAHAEHFDGVGGSAD